MKEAGEAARKKGKVDPYRVEREGAGQVFVVGPPNSGKSALVGKLTNAKVVVAPYPFATAQPVPGMMKYEDILIQLVDTPPISVDNCPPALMASVRSGDAVIMVVDVSSDSCLDDTQSLLDLLEERRIINQEKPHMAAMAKMDLPGAADNAEIVLEAYPDIRFVKVSAESGEGLEELPRTVFDMLDIIRLYSKPPGRDVDRAAPFVLKRGGTVTDLAGAIHRDLPSTMKSARVWGSPVLTASPFQGSTSSLMGTSLSLGHDFSRFLRGRGRECRRGSARFRRRTMRGENSDCLPFSNGRNGEVSARRRRGTGTRWPQGRVSQAGARPTVGLPRGGLGRL